MDELNLNSERLDQLVLHGSSYASAMPCAQTLSWLSSITIDLYIEDLGP